MAERIYIRKIRYVVQFAFLLLTMFAGYRFYQFYLHYAGPGHPFVQKPPSVDGFLPIAGLMSFKYFLLTGIVEPVHPAALIMFTAIVTVSFLLKKGFCGWICPIGTVSQYFWMAGEKILGRNFRMEKYTDLSLRSVKYLVMALFLVIIGLVMATNMMVLFFISDYYKAVDVRTMRFFTEMSTATLIVLISIGGLSLLYRNFWCRYLCPYGALLGLLGCGGPVRVRRNEERCTHCGACSRNCPSLIEVEKKDSVNSPECFSCLTCVGSCPSTGALDLTVRIGKFRRILKPLTYPVILIVLFYLIIGIGVAAGKWHSRLPDEEYRRIIPEMNSTE